MTFESILSDIKNRKFSPLYILQGEEDFFIDEIHDALMNGVLREEERDFNQSIFYGKDCTVPHVIESARRFPMMAEHNFVVVREGQYLKGIEELEAYAKNPTPSTVLLILYKGKKLDGRKSFAKTVAKSGVLYESKRLYDNQVGPWLSSYSKLKGANFNAMAQSLLVENLGNNLVQLANAVSKMAIVIPTGTEITPKHIEQYIGISREYNVFEFINAVGEKNPKKVFEIADHFGNNPKNNPSVLVIGQLAEFFYKLMMFHFSSAKDKGTICSLLGIKPFFFDQYAKAARNYPAKTIVKIYSKIREYDMRFKGKNNGKASEGALLRELSFYILNY